jgi:hypothetical protein
MNLCEACSQTLHHENHTIAVLGKEVQGQDDQERLLKEAVGELDEDQKPQ